jgi:maltooligosyltrehalose trehalohydrolase
LDVLAHGLRISAARMDMGATVKLDGVRFRVWAPAAKRVDVDVEADGRSVVLTRAEDGTWAGVVSDARAGSRYRYRLNGGASYPDPYSRLQPEGPHGPSEVVDPDAFEWHDQDWRGLSMPGQTIYQLHVGTFTREGTFDSLIGQLPRLKGLGVTAIEPLPVAEFPGCRNWGYDAVDLFAPSHVYGGPHGLKRFVDAAHQHDLGVILDVVYNHLGPDGNYLRAFSPDYFTHRYHTPWGEAINYDGRNSRWVRKFVLDNARYWLDEYHVDGLRLDATHAIFDHSPKHILAELSETVHGEGVLIAETHENDVRYLRPVEQGGYGIDAVWADDFHHTLRRYLVGDREGYYADYEGTLDEVARTIQLGWLKPRGTPAGDQPAWRFVYVIQNHDQVGNRAFGERLHHQLDLERYRAASMLLLFLPYTPLLFMGQEFVASSPFLFFTDHNPELGRLVTEGRRKEFAAFSTFTDPSMRERIPDPQDPATFLRSKLPLEEAERPPGKKVHELYQALLRLRRDDPVLADQERRHMQAEALTRDLLMVRRWRAGAERMLFANFADRATGVGYAEWRLLLSSGVSPRTSNPGGWTIPPRTAVILARDD